MKVSYTRGDGMGATVRGSKIVNGKSVWLVSTWSAREQKQIWTIEWTDTRSDTRYENAELAQMAFETIELDIALEDEGESHAADVESTATTRTG